MRRQGMVCVVFAVVVALVGCSSPSGGGGGGGPLPVNYNITASAPYLLQPNTPPAGANGSCRPTAAHPRPVILVHGTVATMGENWAVLSPLLKNNGYCVFAFNYGGTWLSTLTFGNVQGLDGSISAANELRAFVNHVLWATGATKVDIVGHSQGGMLPNYYVKFLGGASKVHSIVGLAPVNHGTTLSGLVTLGQDVSRVFPPLMPFINLFLGLGVPAFVDLQVGSAFMNQLASLPDTVPGINYTVIATQYDQVVTPYQSSFLTGPNVDNITLQSVCNLDYAEHVAIVFDHIALRLVLNALDPSTAVTPVCSPVYAFIGG